MKYVFLISGITGVGGGQKYCSNKVDALIQLGVQPIVISAFEGTVYLENLKQFENNILPELKYKPYLYKRSARENILRRIEAIVGKLTEDDMIESSTVAYSEWGELLASKFGCVHAGYFLDESFRANDGDLKFLKFKHNRRELFGTSDQTLPILFRGKYEIPKEEAYRFKPCCQNVVEDVPVPEGLERIKTEAPVILLLGRLEKPYMLGALQQLKEYFSDRINRKFTLLIVGDTDSRAVKKNIRESVKQFQNAEVVFAGFLSPLPRKLLQNADVCIASAAAAGAVSKEGVPTLYVNTLTAEFVGVLDYTILRGVDHRYGKDREHDLIWALDEVLFNDFCSKNERRSNLNGSDKKAQDQKVMDETQRCLDEFRKERVKEYFDIMAIKPETKADTVSKAVLAAFGFRALDALIFTLWQKVHGHRTHRK